MADGNRPPIEDYKATIAIGDNLDRAEALSVCEWALELERRAAALNYKLDEVSKATLGIFQNALIHGMPYNGPNYKAEYDAMRSLLDQVPKEEKRG